jgi:hypothetical protein
VFAGTSKLPEEDSEPRTVLVTNVNAEKLICPFSLLDPLNCFLDSYKLESSLAVHFSQTY